MVRVERATRASAALERSLAALLPQLNPKLSIPNAKKLKALLADPATTLLVARDGQAIVGTATLIVYSTPAWVKARIEDVVVDGNARGHGVGEALIKECLEVARRRGVQVVELQSNPAREAANRLYPRLGFELRKTNVYRLTLDE
jgi:ribosomal protein S18 acetylase RimI-like enzyme